MLEWLIVGGGIHGTYLSHYLVNARGVQRSHLRVLDPHEEVLAVWNLRSQRVGMQWMRSPKVHHLDLDIDALLRFSELWPSDAAKQPNNRLPYTTFQAHCVKVILENSLHELRLRGQALGLQRLADGWRVSTERGSLDARRVVLATGRHALNWPHWAAALRGQGGAVGHIFEPEFDLARLEHAADIVVVGGGITAGQLALRLARLPGKRITLLTRQPIRRTPYDSNPCWMGPKCRHPFSQTRDYGRRRTMIDEGRTPGTMPDYLAQAVYDGVKAGTLRHFIAEVEAAPCIQGLATLQLASGEMLPADVIILATGFARGLPAPAFLPGLIAAESLPVAACGFPRLDYHLNWGHGLHVSGPLAELELGPVAPNILGARLAAERIGLKSAG